MLYYGISIIHAYHLLSVIVDVMFLNYMSCPVPGQASLCAVISDRFHVSCIQTYRQLSVLPDRHPYFQLSSIASICLAAKTGLHYPGISPVICDNIYCVSQLYILFQGMHPSICPAISISFHVSCIQAGFHHPGISPVIRAPTCNYASILQLPSISAKPVWPPSSKHVTSSM